MSFEDKILEAADNGQNILLHAPGGTGKTYLLGVIARRSYKNGKRVSCTATTGIAAINLSIPDIGLAGSTLHSWAGVGLGDKPPEKLFAMVSHDERARKRWRETNVLIIDEASMLSAEFIDKLDFVGRNIRREKALPFGGLQLIFSGDFLQLPPVNAKWAFQSYVWKEMEVSDERRLFTFTLEEPKRYEDLEWFSLLLRIRKGLQTPEDIMFLHTRSKAYEKWLRDPQSHELTTVKPTMLHSKKVDVEYQNNKELEELPGIPKNYIADDQFTPFNAHARFEHYVKPLDDAIPQCVCLNVGAQVMLKANLDIQAGLANGSRGVVLELVNNAEYGVKVKWFSGKITTVTLHTWTQEDKDGKATRSQIPLILAWSYTIHKSQGCTLDYAICNLGPSVFLEGQAYVALSRVRSSNGLFLTEFYPPSIKTNKDALDYVKKIEQSCNVPTCAVKSVKKVQLLNFIGIGKKYWLSVIFKGRKISFTFSDEKGDFELSRFGRNITDEGINIDKNTKEIAIMQKNQSSGKFYSWSKLWIKYDKYMKTSICQDE